MMLTRSRHRLVDKLITAFEKEREALKVYHISSETDEEKEALITARMLRRAERAAAKERRLLSLRRTLRYGEVKRIVELRFKEVGSTVPRGLSFGKISRKLYIRLRTVQSVCRAYLHRGGTI